MARKRAILAVLLALACSAQAEDAFKRPDDRGWVFGMGLTGGQINFANTDGRAVALGPVDGYVVLGSTAYAQRDLHLVDGSNPPPADTVAVKKFPRSQGGLGFTLHAGYAFSPRVALLAHFEVLAPTSDGFSHFTSAAVVRYSPASRLWVEAGPAAGDIGYAYADSTTRDGSLTGGGFATGAGLSVLKRNTWSLDVQARYSRIWYEGLDASTVSFGLSVGRIRSGASASH